MVARKSVALTPEKKLTALLIKVLIFLDGFTQSGLKNIVNVYLVTVKGWSPLDAAWVWLIEISTRLVYQPLIGTVVDRVKIHKYTILVIIALLKIGSGVCALTSSSFWAMAVKSVFDGFTSASFLTTVTAMSLGVLGKTRFHKKVAASNNILEESGSVAGLLLCGIISYYMWSDVYNTFWVLIGGGILMLLCTFFMLSDSDSVVDHERARGRSVASRRSSTHEALVGRASRFQSIRNFADTFLQADTDEDESDVFDAKDRDPKAENQDDEAETGNPSEEVERANVNSFEASTAALSYTQIMTFKQMYADPKRRRSLICLSMVYFTYHIANSTTVPLLGQLLGSMAEDGRSSLPIMSGLMLTNSLFKALTNWFLKNDRASKIGYTNVLLIGSGTLCLRLVLLGILAKYTDGNARKWAMGATQVLDGIGGGCLDLMMMLYSHLLSRRTGHFNFNMGIVTSWKTGGSMVGIVAGGAMADYWSYEMTFWVMAGVSVFPMIFSLGISTPDLKRID